MRRQKRIAALIAASALLGVPASAAAAPDNWGQEVSACNKSSCYPGGTNRGAYVREQARDSEGPGYGAEIQALALAPRGHGNGGF